MDLQLNKSSAFSRTVICLQSNADSTGTKDNKIFQQESFFNQGYSSNSSTHESK